MQVECFSLITKRYVISVTVLLSSLGGIYRTASWRVILLWLTSHSHTAHQAFRSHIIGILQALSDGFKPLSNCISHTNTRAYRCFSRKARVSVKYVLRVVCIGIHYSSFPLYCVGRFVFIQWSRGLSEVRLIEALHLHIQGGTKNTNVNTTLSFWRFLNLNWKGLILTLWGREVERARERERILSLELRVDGQRQPEGAGKSVK